MKNSVIDIPTGKIIVDTFTDGQLEFLSIGDYGQAANIKADFLGLDREIEGVPDGQIMPLEDKWVITISTQYGCSMKCKFCDVPAVGPGRNVSEADLFEQILLARRQHPEVHSTQRLNIHYARMGEPTFNPAVLDVSRFLATQGETALDLPCGTLHPVLTTMMPKRNKHLKPFLDEWIDLKNNWFHGEANLQVSINSTSDEQRDDMYQGCTHDLETISKLVNNFPDPIGRKYCLNFALADDYETNGAKLATLFDSSKWMVKITPIHVNTATDKNGIKTTDGYDTYEAYRYAENEFKNAGFDTLVFVPSYDEDYGMITCGNVILSGNRPTIPYSITEKAS